VFEPAEKKLSSNPFILIGGMGIRYLDRSAMVKRFVIVCIIVTMQLK